MILKPYIGSVSAEIDEACHNAEKHGYLTLILIGSDSDGANPRHFVITTKEVIGTRITDVTTVPNFLREFGRH